MKIERPSALKPIFHKENNECMMYVDIKDCIEEVRNIESIIDRIVKEQMMKGAIDAKIGSFTNGTIYDADFNIDSNLKDSDKVKVIVIKEECR